MAPCSNSRKWQCFSCAVINRACRKWRLYFHPPDVYGDPLPPCSAVKINWPPWFRHIKQMYWVSRLPVRLHQSTQSTPCQVFYTGISHVSSASLPQPGQSLMLCRMLPSWFLWKSLLWNVCPRKLWLCVYQYPSPRGEGRQDVNCDVMSVNSVRTTGSFSFLLS